MDLHVTWYDTTGKALLDKIYYSEEIEGESYMFSGRAEEKLNQLLHKLLADLMTRAAQETIELVNAR